MFDEDVGVDAKRLSKKRPFVESTIKIQESSEEDGEEYEDSQELSTPAPVLANKAPAADTKIILNLFDDDELITPPVAKKQKKVEPSPKPLSTEPFFKSQLPPTRGMMPPPDPIVKEIK